MIVSQLVAIGNLIEQDEYVSLVDRNRAMRKGLIIGADINIWKEGSAAVLRSYEYDDEQRYLYALGSVPSRRSQPSICFPINYPKWKEARNDKTKAQVLQNSANLGRILVGLRSSTEPIVVTTLHWLESSLSRVYQAISDFLFEQDFTGSNAPRWIVFRVRESARGEYRWPGELEAFRQQYVDTYSKGAVNGESAGIDGTCFGCRQHTRLASSFREMMTYTLDQAGYAIGFDGDQSRQFMLCRRCLSKAVIGMNTLNRELTFFAFSIQKTMKTKVPVRYLVVPNANSSSDLEACITAVAKTSREGVAASTWSLKEMMKMAERRSLELPETLAVLPHQLSYTVLFFTTDRTSGMKKSLGSYFFPGSRLREINEILSTIASGFGLERQTQLKMERLYHLMGSKTLTEFLSALFLGTHVDKAGLVKAAVISRSDDKMNTLRTQFLNMVRENNRAKKATLRGYVSRKVRDLLVVHDALCQNNLLGE